MATESFFSNASLAYLASAGAGKDGKAYSIKPTDGTGDFTFSRGSNLAATRVGADGLIEKGRENLLLQSNNFDTTWFNVRSTETGGQTDKDGGSTAWLLESTDASTSYIQQDVSNSGVQTFSVIAKKGTTDFMYLLVFGSNFAGQYFDLNNGTLANPVYTTIDASIEDLGGGWYRCSLFFQSNVTHVTIYPADSGTSSLSAVGSNIYIQDAQLEIGLAATDYIESEATTGKAGLLEDEPRFDYSGGATCGSLLLEPSRTNLVQSEYFGAYTKSDTSILTNQAQSPEGLVNASLIAETATNSNHYFGLTSGVSVVSGTTYTFSVFIKKGDGASAPDYCQLTFNFAGFGAIYANFNLSNGTIGALSGVTPLISDSTINGFWRCSITATATSTANTGAIVAFTNNNDSLGRLPSYLGNTASDFYAYGFQVEEGSYPTSYIPNHSGGSVTRGNDALTTLDITSLVTGTPFTWFLDLNEWQGSDTNIGDLILLNSTARIELRVRNDGYRILYNAINAGTSYPISASKTARKFCIKYDGSNFKLFRDGVLENTTASAGDTGWSEITQTAGGATLPLDQMLLFNEALSDADCISLTTL